MNLLRYRHRKPTC